MKTITIKIFTFLSLVFCTCIAMAQTDVLTQHNNLSRTGWDSTETILNHQTVNANSFGLLYTMPVDDQVFAQPLVVSQITMPGHGLKNVVYLCTVNNSVYAYDADNGTLYWHKNYMPTGWRAPNAGDIHPSLCESIYWDFTGNFGIVGTPVIDKGAQIMYFVTKMVDDTSTIDNHTFNYGVSNEEYTYTTNGFHQYLHAVNLTTGAELFGGPKEIIASVAGLGDGSSGGVIKFDPRRQFNRAGLVLSNGIVYVAMAGHCDWNPAHGWLFGFNASNLNLQIKYLTTPNDGRGGIWMSGGAPAVDAAGNIYFTTGNANDSATTIVDGQGAVVYNVSPSVTANRGESVVKVTPNTLDNTATSVSVTDFFTPYNFKYYNEGDVDFPVQVMLVPNKNWLLTGCKDQNLYLMDQSNLGGYNTSTNNVLQVVPVTSDPNAGAEMHSSFAYFGGSDNSYIYQLAENTNLEAFPIGTSSLGSAIVVDTSYWPKGGSTVPSVGAGGFMSVSSKGTDTSTGILWITHAINDCDGAGAGCQGVLRAVRANHIQSELWNSQQYLANNLGTFGKMNCPTIANGKVYVGSSGGNVAVFGALGTSFCSPPVSLGASTTASSVANSGVPAASITDGNVTTNWASNSGDHEWIYIDLGSKYDICNITINWKAIPLSYSIDVSTDASTWTTVYTASTYASTNLLQVSGGTASFLGQRYVRMKGISAGVFYSGYSMNEFQVLGTASASPLPVNLLSFTASNVNNEYAKLNWQTASGSSAASFDIEKSLDGISFSKIGSMSAVINSTTDQSYSFNDVNPSSGINNYRLKLTDINGKITYSSIDPVKFTKGLAPYITPNPADQYFMVMAGQDAIKDISIYDVSGKLIEHLANESANSAIRIPTTRLASGIYIVEIRTVGETYQEKLFKQ